ncbi:MAG: ATP-grasp domain-containing protein [Pseudomonadota bacterium]
MLIIGAGVEQVPAYELGLKMGLIVVGSDMNPEAPGFKLTDERIIASTYDARETLEEASKFHRKNPIDGVMTLANDVPMTVAVIAKELQVPGISIETARLSSNKLLQLERFREDRIPVPDYREVRSKEQLRRIIDEWGYPLIIKPPDNRGARGVLRLTKGFDVEWAFNETISHSETRSIVAQKFIEGYQISSESFVLEGKCYTAMYSGRNYEFLERFSPHIIENGGWLPAGITEQETRALDEVVQRVVDSLRVKNGPLKGDLVLTGDGPVVIEFTPRMGGGYAVSHSIPLTHGVNLVAQVIKMSLGLPVDVTDLIPRYKQSAALRFFFPKPGIVEEIKGFEKLDKYGWVVLKRIYCKVGDVIEEVTNHTKRSGCVIAVGKDKKEAEERAKEAISSVQIITR